MLPHEAFFSPIRKDLHQLAGCQQLIEPESESLRNAVAGRTSGQFGGQII
jgi:hypothetical protein